MPRTIDKSKQRSYISDIRRKIVLRRTLTLIWGFFKMNQSRKFKHIVLDVVKHVSQTGVESAAHVQANQ